MNIKGKTAIVTGASSGIGEAIARSLAAAGANVVLAARSEDDLKRVAESLDGEGESLVIPTDVSEENHIRRMVDKTVERFGAVDILINNAGLARFHPIEELTIEEFDRMVAVNLRGVFIATKFALEQMYEQKKGGAVVTISSIAGKRGFAKGSGYNASKFGVMGMMEGIFLEARKHDVRVITITPGSVDTPLFDDSNMAPPNRDKILQPEDVAETVMHALQLPQRALIRELDIRPSNP